MILFLGPAAALALAYGAVWTLRPVSLTRSVIKTGATALLALAALTQGLPLIALALTAGALGDWFLSRPRDRGFLPGLGAFLVGHAVYLWVLWPLAHWPGVLPVLVLLACAAAVMLRLWPLLGALRGPVAAYAALSVVLGGVALGVPQGVLAGGVLAFIASDILLAVSLFLLPAAHPRQPLLARGLWALYWGGQAAILIGTAQAFSAIDAVVGIT